MKSRGLKSLALIIFIVLVGGGFFVLRDFNEEATAEDQLTQHIDDFLTKRQEELLREGNSVDPFAEDNEVKILLIGLDNRTGQTLGHCDAIQLIEINKETGNIHITAVPRGTYSPLPYGVAATTSDYYVSNSCGLVSLEYGIEQIEKILGKRADYIVVVGFSEVLGILKYLDLPTTPTLQWLRHRQGYAIGEPQRAHNHSTFLKKLFTTYTPKENSALDTSLQYILYKLVKTDLSFEETRVIIQVLSDMKLNTNPERVSLSMRPAYAVQDIPYDENNLEEYLHTMIDPIKKLLSSSSYSGSTKEEIEKQILDKIEKGKDDAEFITWAFENNLWLQIEDEQNSQQIQYDIMTLYISSLPERAERMRILTDYIIEMDYRGLSEWSGKAKNILADELPS